jgi:cell division protein FtsL
MATNAVKAPAGRSIVTLVLAMALVIAIGVIVRRVYGRAQQAEIAALNRQVVELESRRAQLRADIRNQSSRRTLAPIVEQRLGMKVPADSQVIMLARPAEVRRAP